MTLILLTKGLSCIKRKSAMDEYECRHCKGRRYELFCRKLILERHYTASAFISSSSQEGLKGAFKAPAEDLSMERFAKILTAHVASFI